MLVDETVDGDVAHGTWSLSLSHLGRRENLINIFKEVDWIKRVTKNC